jgi:hypothetical protein
MTAEATAPENPVRVHSGSEFKSELKNAPGRLKDSLIAEFAVAVAWVMAYAKGGRTWAGLSRLAVTYQWPLARTFHDLIAPGLAAHARLIAWLFPLVLMLFASSWNWPIGSYVLFWCGMAYSYLTLGQWWSILMACMVIAFGYAIFGRRNQIAFANFIFALLIGLAVAGLGVWL